jgi:ABC-type transporter Mla MlaB component
MFRITTQTADDELVMKLEGSLTGAWVREADTCWRDVMTAMEGRRVRIDLTAVCHVDARGRELMAVMHRAGAQFVTKGCVMPEVVREISESADAGLAHRRAKREGGSPAEARSAKVGL